MQGPDPVFVLRGTNSPVTCLKYLTSDVLYSGDQDGMVNIWNMSTKRQITKMACHAGQSVLWIDFINSQMMVTQGRDGIVQFWEKSDNQWSKSDTLQSDSLGYCPCTKVENIIVVPVDVSTMQLYDMKSKMPVGILKPNRLKGKYGMCMTCCCVEGKSQIIVGYENGFIALWDVRSLKMVDQLRMHDDSVMGLDIKSHIGISGSVTDKLKIWSVGEKLIENSQIITTNPGFNQIKIRNDQKIFATAGWDSTVRIFSFRKLKPLAVLSYHKSSVNCLAFSPDNILACGSKDFHISLWDLYP